MIPSLDVNGDPVDPLASYHVHEIEEHEVWIPGMVCDDCRAKPHKKSGKNVNWNIERLRRENKDHYTQRMIRDDIYESARRDGRDIQRAR